MPDFQPFEDFLTESRSATLVQEDLPWNVLVRNDPVNLMNYVVMVFKRVFGYSNERARKHMLEVHERGVSCLWTGSRERAEHYVHTLHQWQIRAELSQYSGNDDFSKDYCPF